MNAPINTVSILSKCYEHQQRLDNVFKDLSNDMTLSAINHLKTQMLLLSDWLFELTPTNSDIVLAQALSFNKSLLPHTNQAFLAAIIATKFSHRLHFHGQHAALLVHAALTMNISLLIDNSDICLALHKRQKLDKNQLHRYQKYPLMSAQFLNKYNLLDKSALHWILNHKEQLNGSGFPAGIKQHKIPTNTQILGLISRFTELILPKENGVIIKTKQVLAHLVRHQHHFNINLINQLIQLIDKPLPSFIYQLNKTQYAFIVSTDYTIDNNSLQMVPFSVEENSLSMSKELEEDTIDYQRHYMPPPTIISQKIMTHFLQDYKHEPLEDISGQTQRLKPHSELSSLLNELSTHLPDTSIIESLIAQQPILGEKLIAHLQQQYPESKFNNSYHAIQMAGFPNVPSLLSRLALNAQLSYFQFQGSIDLQQKVNCAVNISQAVGGFCRHVLPNELAMFTQLNLAPLYLDQHVVNSKFRQLISFEKCAIHHGFSLAGLNNTTRQPKVTMALAKIWAPKKSLLNAISGITHPDLIKTKKEREFVAGFELAIYITHSVFHDFDLNDIEHETRLTAICRDLKIKAHDLQLLQQTALSHHPLCEL